MLIEVEYRVKYNINTSVEISEVKVAFVLGSIGTGGASFLKQTFSYIFAEVCMF